MFLNEYERSKENEDDDSIFYRTPRFAHHLESKFRSALTKLYRSELQPSSVILDLMSSWHSHLPPEIHYQSVIGHGLNEEELKYNQRLNQYWLQDLNKNQNLPLDNNSIDYCLIVAGWQYLQYPEKITSELLRVVKEQGKLIVSFSNRAFWDKAPMIWVERNDQQRVEYVEQILIQNQWKNIKSIQINNNNHLLSRLFGKFSDPFLSVIAKKTK